MGCFLPDKKAPASLPYRAEKRVLIFSGSCSGSGILQLTTACGLEVSEDEAVEVAVHDSVHVAGLVVGAVVLDHRVGHEDVGADLVAPCDLVLDALDVCLLYTSRCV